jgi:hypothetical protein
MRRYTLDQALANWEFCFNAGWYRAAQGWWAIVKELHSEEVGNG